MTVMLRLVGSVLVEILEVPSQLLISVQKSAEMESTEAGIPVMMEIYKMAMDALLIVFKNPGIDVLEETLRLLIIVQSCVEMGLMRVCWSVMMRIW